MCDFFGKNFDTDKTIQYSKLRKEMAKKDEAFGPIKTPTNARADLSIEERKKFEEKIKLENKLRNQFPLTLTVYQRILLH